MTIYVFVLIINLAMASRLMPGLTPNNPESPIVPTQFRCGTRSNNVMAPTLAYGFRNWPTTGSSTLSFSFSAQLLDRCAISGVEPLTFLLLGTTTDNRKIFSCSVVERRVSVSTETTTEIKVITDELQIQTAFGLNDWIEFAGSVDLKTGFIQAAAGIVSDTISNTLTNVSYSTWILDNTTTSFTWCVGFTCRIKDFRVWYDFTTILIPALYLGGPSALLQGYYKLDEMSGRVLANIMSNSTLMTNAYLGDPSMAETETIRITHPHWSSTDYAIQFTNRSQFVTLPNFATTPSNDLTSASLSFSAYLRVNAAPVQGLANIFSILSANLSTMKFGVTIDNHLNVGYLTGEGPSSLAATASSTKNLTLGTWNRLLVTFQIRADLQNTRTAIFYSDGYYFYSTYKYPSLSTAVKFCPDDKVRLGGTNTFIGEIALVSVYAPGTTNVGTVVVADSSHQTAPGTVTDFALSGSAVAASQPTLPYCISWTFVVEDRHCVPCEAGSFGKANPQPTHCLKCLPPCQECTSEIDCLSCIPNYAFNSRIKTCTQCNDGTYYDSQTSTCQRI